MLCALFVNRLAYLERTRPMALHDLARSATRARKRYALSVASLAHAETPKAQKRAERRARAARRSLLEAARAADALEDFTPA